MSTPLFKPLLRELRVENEGTRELLTRLPSDFDFRPHERSMSLGRLATHITECVKYGWQVLERDSIDSSRAAGARAEMSSHEAILEAFDRHRDRFETKLGQSTDAHLLSRWQYRKGETVIFDVRRISALRRFVLNHLVHHRGQLTVYLRILDVALPQIYGPSADDNRGY